MIVISGAAGFIGFNIAKRLNLMGIEDLILLDDKEKFPKPKKFLNLKFKEYRHYRDLKNLGNITCIFHQGACSDTMEYDKDFMMDINFEYSKEILSIAKSCKSKFIYASSASVYGLNEDSKEIRANEAPLNIYAESKLLFDQYVMAQDYSAVGLRYFNVYGRGEENKGKMASMAYKMNEEYVQSKQISLFKGTGGYKNGEQKRDFVFVDDCVDVNLWFMKNPKKSGIFNVGSGKARTINELANIVLNWHKEKNFLTNLSIEYIPFPNSLKSSYQSFTESDNTKLRKIGYKKEFIGIEEGIFKYLNQLNKKS